LRNKRDVLPHLKKYAKERSDTEEKPVNFPELFSLAPSD